MQDYLSFKEHCHLFRVPVSELLFLESVGCYVRLVTPERVYMVRGSLYKWEAALPPDLFCRIHRSYIVSFRHARQVDSRTVLVAGRELPIGRRFRGLLWSRMELKKRVERIYAR